MPESCPAHKGLEENIKRASDDIAETKESLKDLVSEFKTEFKDLMSEMRSVLQDTREVQTITSQLRAETTQQWEKMTSLGKRVEILEKEVALSVSAARLVEHEKEADTRFGIIEREQAERRGKEKIFMLIPTVFTLLFGAVAALMGILRYLDG